MKIAFGMIVFEGDYVLKQVLEQIYPFAHQILIAEGPVKYFQDLGKATSEDRTNAILNGFPDPQNKIVVVHGRFSEKDDQSNAYMKHLDPETDYLWQVDSDECYKTEDIAKVIAFLSKHQPTTAGVQSCSFYGGFDHYLTGFELNTDNFLRIFRVYPGSYWKTHRPPTMAHVQEVMAGGGHLSSDVLYKETGVQMYHYSYVYPSQVFNKVAYYRSKVSRDRCIEDYFLEVYLPWVRAAEHDKALIEKKYMGVHEFKPQFRSPCFTAKFEGGHPESVLNDITSLKARLLFELKLLEQSFVSFEKYCSRYKLETT